MPGPMSSLLIVRLVATGVGAALTGVTVSALGTTATCFGAARCTGGGGGGFGFVSFFFSSVTATEIAFFLAIRPSCAEIRPTASPAWIAAESKTVPIRMCSLAGLLNVDRELGDARQLGHVEHVHDVAVLDLLVGAHHQAHLGVGLDGLL